MVSTFLARWITCSCVMLCAGFSAVAAEARISVADHDHVNLFDVDDPVRFQVTLQGFPDGTGELVAQVTDFFGEVTSVRAPVTLPADGKHRTLDLGDLVPGYYELVVSAEVAGKQARSDMRSFGVVHFMDRNAAEALAEGSRFGLKIFQIGEPGVWWRKGTVWDLSEVVDATARMGLQWTRHELDQKPEEGQEGILSTQDLIKDHEMNLVLKVEGFSAECFDAARYGPLEEFRKRKKNWNRQSVPLKEPYQQWLKEKITALPHHRHIVFEIGNEVWNYMSAEEFAQWAQMAMEAIREVRPEAKVGVDMGVREYARTFIDAGGMAGMDVSFLHPYSFTPLPEHRVRGLVRDHHDLLQRWAGKHCDLYVTEYGWPVAPEDKRKLSVSEKIQAQRTTRQSLMLYAEDVKALIPHMMGDREQNPDDWDDWFGFFRLNGQPRAVVVAHATAARMIDGSTFKGDLWYGPGIGAMLFERDGTHTLALWTAEDARSATVDVAVPEVTLVNLMGAERKIATDGGKLHLELDGSVIYLVGVGSSLVAQAAPPGSKLNPERWSQRVGSLVAQEMATAPTVDGDLADWQGIPAIGLNAAGTATGSAAVTMAWDAKHLHVALAVSGQEAGATDQQLEIGVGVRPDRQIEFGSTAIYDFIFLIPSPEGRNQQMTVRNRGMKVYGIEVDRVGHESGIAWESKPTSDGWTAELTIPIGFLEGIPTPIAGETLSARFILKQVKEKGRDEVLFSLGDRVRTAEWPALVLESSR